MIVDGTGLLCVTLLIRLRAAIAQAEPNTVVHVIATDPAAPLGLPAWCHMTGHHYLGMTGHHHHHLGPVLDDTDSSVYALRLSADARPTRPDAPWRPSTPER
ncbi:sulfurtransferase TusA family protein [Streptomyces piniterrae]|uniref:Sulfurtransferase TusA family protein n=1 Tax=Streptomyces piniterrae TaxID=2571125 RepID=A0A4U0NK25_9ACTN|nr:sulfurtransferase TusA family protein [Streptomyces piniterrae]